MARSRSRSNEKDNTSTSNNLSSFGIQHISDQKNGPRRRLLTKKDHDNNGGQTQQASPSNSGGQSDSQSQQEPPKHDDGNQDKNSSGNQDKNGDKNSYGNQGKNSSGNQDNNSSGNSSNNSSSQSGNSDNNSSPPSGNSNSDNNSSGSGNSSNNSGNSSNNSGNSDNKSPPSGNSNNNSPSSGNSNSNSPPSGNSNNNNSGNSDNNKKYSPPNNNNNNNNNNNSNNNSPPLKKSPPPPAPRAPPPPPLDTTPRVTDSDSPPSNVDTLSNSSKAIIAGVACGTLLLLAFVILCLMACCKRRKRDKDHGSMNYYMDTVSEVGNYDYYSDSGRHKVTIPPPGRQNSCESWLQSLAEPPPPPPVFTNAPSVKFNTATSENSCTFEQLSTATGNFSKSNMLGQGRDGFVHKGVLPNGKEIAVKTLKSVSGKGEKEFLAEMEHISRVRHRHLVSLVGYCVSTDSQRLLVYEFVPNLSLEYHLQGKDHAVMDSSTRLKIAVGSAKGIAYLHEECHPPIVHRDINAANILLDYNYEAKVADFGVAKLSNDNFNTVSFGYLAPEYAKSGRLTKESDVYSFGVLLVELITGKRPMGLTGAQANLLKWASPLLEQGTKGGSFEKLVDQKLGDKYDHQEMLRMVCCAAACIRPTAKSRPTMSQVVRALEGEAKLEELNPSNNSNPKKSDNAKSDVFGLGVANSR